MAAFQQIIKKIENINKTGILEYHIGDEWNYKDTLSDSN